MKAIPLLVFLFSQSLTPRGQSLDDEVKNYLEQLDTKLSQSCHLKEVATWTMETNQTIQSTMIATDYGLRFRTFETDTQAEVLKKFPNWKEIKDDFLRRQIKYIVRHGGSNMSMDDMANIATIAGSIQNIVESSTVCDYHNRTKCDLRLEPEVEGIMETSTDPDELSYYYDTWHDLMSELIPKESFTDYIEILNKFAASNHFDSASEILLSDFNDDSPTWNVDTFNEYVHQMWYDIQPYYKKLHAYIRMKLRRFEKYEPLIKKCGPIPVHLMGNMGNDLYQSREALVHLTKPYPDVKASNFTQAIIDAGYTPLKIFQTAEKFFVEMGLPPMTADFWQNSMFVKPDPEEENREVTCDTSADDMCAGKNSTDFRIKHCATVSHDSLIIAHHEMTHIQYYMHYAHLPYLFRFGPNPSFSEGLADAVDLIPRNPTHLKCILGLNIAHNINCSAAKSEKPSEIDMNFLYYSAIQHFTQLSFTIAQNKWRWEVIKDKVQPRNYNTRWWDIRLEIQGLVPPVERPSDRFDAAGKHQNLVGVDGMNYFLSYVLQKQFFEALCKAAGEYDPQNPKKSSLYQCNFYGSKTAGKKMADMMRLGSSKPWPDAIQELTGIRTFSVQPLLNFYTPLFQYIDKELRDNREYFGYDGKC